MKNGVKIARMTAGGYKSVFIPEEIIQINQLNRRIQRNVEAKEKAIAEEQARLTAISRRKHVHRAKIKKTIRGCFILAAVTCATWLSVSVGLAEPILAAVVSTPCLCGICYKLGTISKGDYQ